MAGTINPEDAVGAMKSIIEADLPAKLDSLDTEYGATGAEVLDDIAKVWLAPQERHQVSNIPALTIAAAETEWDQERGEQEAIYQHRIVAELLLRGNDRTTDYAPEELLTVKLQRTVRGLIETLEAKRHLTVSGSKNADYIAFEGVAYSELDASQGAVEKRAELSFLVLVSV
jgi:hypothetical protein